MLLEEGSEDPDALVRRLSVLLTEARATASGYATKASNDVAVVVIFDGVKLFQLVRPMAEQEENLFGSKRFCNYSGPFKTYNELAI